MFEWDLILKLMNCFPGSFINQYGEFIAHDKGNQYFTLKNCNNELDIKCKILEWFSRGAYKTEPFKTWRLNDDLHKFMLAGINKFLQTDFTPEDIGEIYIYLGNACNHNKTIQFIESGYDLTILKEGK